MSHQQLSLFSTPRPIAEFVQEIEALTREIQQLYCQDHLPWIIGYSGGKDSSCVLQLVWNAILQLPPSQRHKKVYVITTDTRVENPVIASWIKNRIAKIQEAAAQHNMPFEAHLLYPEVKDSFWVCLIGKGYPAPRRGFRWCTERLKIQPADTFIRKTLRRHGEIVLVLGTRKTESLTRAINMEKRALRERIQARLNLHPRFPNSYIYTPIEDWQTSEVWFYLLQYPNPWGGDNQDLFALYRGASADNECPLVLDTQTPSCGDSRFGCWVCTMVSKDKSMEAMIQNDEEKQWLQPLLDLRNELDAIDDRDKRDFRRLNGKVELYERRLENGQISIEPIPGPYLKKWREYWLRKLLEAQVSIRKNAPPEYRDVQLISIEELHEIRRIWLEEKHEFDDSLPLIYEEVTGEKFPYPTFYGRVDKPLLGREEWKLLEEICGDDALRLELITRLLDIERQYYTKIRRVGIYKALEKCLETTPLSKEEAIARALKLRKVRKAARNKDTKALQKTISWGEIKFRF